MELPLLPHHSCWFLQVPDASSRWLGRYGPWRFGWVEFV
ncbi:hypothetical protein LINGRAPRIM_LOCUS1269 [Linum grandiflorum]